MATVPTPCESLRMKLVLSSFLLAFVAGCYAEATVPAPTVRVSAPPPVVIAPAPVVVEAPPPPPPPEPAPVVVEDEDQPDLVEVSPGVQVIYDYDEPIFFSDGFYWRQTGGVWYSSRSYRGGWGVYSGVPVRFRGMDTHRYVHYRPAGYVPRRTVDVRGGVRGEVRDDHRGEVRGEVREERHDERHDERMDHDNRVQNRGGAPAHTPPARGNGHERHGR